MGKNSQDAFTGLEAAIVLIAFVVVAAVFSYVVLGAGFFTTQKSQEVVYTSVDQASSSIEILGDVYANSTVDAGVDSTIDGIQFVIGLTAGGSPVDLAQTTMTFATEANVTKIYNVTDISSTASDVTSAKADIGPDEWGIIDIANDDGDKGALLENQEQFTVYVLLDDPNEVSRNKEFSLNIRPATGSSYSIVKTAPSRIKQVNLLR